MKVDVELQNHPPSDDMAEKMMALGTRKPGTLNPFVVGEANYSKFIDVMSELHAGGDCAEERIATWVVLGSGVVPKSGFSEPVHPALAGVSIDLALPGFGIERREPFAQSR